VLFRSVGDRQVRRFFRDCGYEIVQVGTNLAMAELAALAEPWLDKPVIAINTATYWYALRSNGITDRIHGFGSLLVEH
jgi:maleate isomerase